MRSITLFLLLGVVAAMMFGCAANPAAPGVEPSGATDRGDGLPFTRLADVHDGPYRLWGEWTLEFSSEHDSVEVIPQRNMHFHLNTLKFLEDYCTDCLQVPRIRNNGDGTIDMTVRLTHPFPGHPELTGFDVKGIIMFNGSHEIPDNMEKYPLYPQNYRLSWRLMGDPELMNADGYTYRWSPWYESGSDLPIFNYWEGRWAKGTPTANVNGYINFYSREERYIFEHNQTVSRIYTIWLPPGEEVVAGYAVEACWEPPINKPVTDPVVDFPVSANQPEAYHFKCVINDGNPIDDPECCMRDGTIHDARAEIYTWYIPEDGSPTSRWVGIWNEKINFYRGGFCAPSCDGPPEWRCLALYPFRAHPDGVYQLIGIEFHDPWPPEGPQPHITKYPAMDVFEVIIDIG